MRPSCRPLLVALGLLICHGVASGQAPAPYTASQAAAAATPSISALPASLQSEPAKVSFVVQVTIDDDTPAHASVIASALGSQVSYALVKATPVAFFEATSVLGSDAFAAAAASWGGGAALVTPASSGRAASYASSWGQFVRSYAVSVSVQNPASLLMTLSSTCPATACAAAAPATRYDIAVFTDFDVPATASASAVGRATDVRLLQLSPQPPTPPRGQPNRLAAQLAGTALSLYLACAMAASSIV